MKRNGSALGIDASTKTIAFCYMEPDGRPVFWGEFDLATVGNDLFVRLGQAYSSIENLLDVILVEDHGVDISGMHCYIESAVKINNIKTTINLSYMYGIIIAAMSARGIKVHEVPPITWQNFIGNKALTPSEKNAIQKQYAGMSQATVKSKMRQFRKARTQKWVEEKFGKTISSDNICDAFGVSWYGIHQ